MRKCVNLQGCKYKRVYKIKIATHLSVFFRLFFAMFSLALRFPTM